MTVSISSDIAPAPASAHAKTGPKTTSRKETAAHVSLSSDALVKQRWSLSPGPHPPARPQPKPENKSPIPYPKGLSPPFLRPGDPPKAKKSAKRPTPLLSREVRVSSSARKPDEKSPLNAARRRSNPYRQTPRTCQTQFLKKRRNRRRLRSGLGITRDAPFDRTRCVVPPARRNKVARAAMGSRGVDPRIS